MARIGTASWHAWLCVNHKDCRESREITITDDSHPGVQPLKVQQGSVGSEGLGESQRP